MIRAWRSLFRSHILERGLDYYEEDAVVSLEETAIAHMRMMGITVSIALAMIY